MGEAAALAGATKPALPHGRAVTPQPRATGRVDQLRFRLEVT